MKTDSYIKRDVEFELKWDPDIDATDIAVSEERCRHACRICPQLHPEV